MMRKMLATGWLLLAAPSYATQPIGCDARLQAVNKELEFAKMHNNSKRTAKTVLTVVTGYSAGTATRHGRSSLIDLSEAQRELDALQRLGGNS